MFEIEQMYMYTDQFKEQLKCIHGLTVFLLRHIPYLFHRFISWTYAHIFKAKIGRNNNLKSK